MLKVGCGELDLRNSPRETGGVLERIYHRFIQHLQLDDSTGHEMAGASCLVSGNCAVAALNLAWALRPSNGRGSVRICRATKATPLLC